MALGGVDPWHDVWISAELTVILGLAIIGALFVANVDDKLTK